jgi:methionyl-tRNA formyltransferase
MKVLFYGTPDFALPTLDALLRHHQVVAVVTQPDRPAHRGQRPTPPAVKARADAAGVPIVQPPRLRDPGWPERLAIFGADVAVVVAFGQILPRAVLNVPSRGSINVHASLLPRYRGAAPIAWAIMRGERATGLTTFQMDEGMDTGAILKQTDAVPIGPEETAGELAARLAVLGAELLIDTLARLDTLTPRAQRREDASMAPRLKKSDGYLDWERPASELVNVVRGCNPWPGALTTGDAGRLSIWRARAVGSGREHPPGLLYRHEGQLVIATSDGAVLPVEVQAENKRPMNWPEYLRGSRLAPGGRLLRPVRQEP